MVPQVSEATHKREMVITWEALPNDFRLEDDPVDNTSQPKVAAALSEILAETVEAPHHICTRIGVGMNTSEM